MKQVDGKIWRVHLQVFSGNIQESKITVESAYAEQIEKELRKSVLLFPQFCLPEALRRFSRNLEGIL